MKKNKTYTLVLTGAVVTLWVVVLYKFYNSFWGEGTVADTVIKNDKIGVLKAEVNELFILKANYPDPFSGKAFQNERPSGEIKRAPKAKQALPKKEEVTVDFSFISYLGLIKNQASQKQVALVSVHGKEYMVSEGDQINEVSFVKNFKDSIKVSYMGEVSFIRKK